ncbi:MAG: hypothetical protein ACI4L7_01670 [Christensenellales bacterium]
MDIYLILTILLGCVCLFMLVLLIAINKKYSKMLNAMRNREVDNINQKNGVRYTVDQTVMDENGEMNVSLSQKDIILKQNETQTAGIKNKLKPGKYTVLSSGDDEKFNIRVGNLVKEYRHGQSIIIAEGEEITAVSSTVILR